jgi:proteasome lid subunit RPN8/RPN11
MDWMKMNTGGSTRGRTRGIERCWVLVGQQYDQTTWHFRRRRLTAGEIASVEADWEWTLKREDRYGDVIGFFHTHPHGMGVQPSSRDVRTMRAWCTALGKPLLCIIASGKLLEGQVFVNEDQQPVRAESIRKEKGGLYIVKVVD